MIMNTYQIWVAGQMAQTLYTKDFDSSFAARRWMAERYDLHVTDIVARRVWSGDYNPVAVDDAIAASNRSGRRIGSREARAIHALLKGPY
jgi:acyl dehydratase